MIVDISARLRYNDVGIKANFETIAGEPDAGCPIAAGAAAMAWLKEATAGLGAGHGN